MAKKLLLSNDGVVQQVFCQDSVDRKIYLQSRMEGRHVQAILDQNQIFRRETRARSWGHHAASIPRPLYEQWQREWKKNARQDQTWHQYLFTQLNKPEYAYLRTVDHRLVIPK